MTSRSCAQFYCSLRGA